MKKTVLAILIAAIVLICSCTAEETPEILPDYNTEQGEIDLEGYKFVYLMDAGSDSTVSLGYKDTTLPSDAAKKRIAETQASLHYTFVPRYTNDLITQVNLAASSGASGVSAVQWTQYTDSLQSAVRNDRFYPISYLGDYIDYKNADKWGSPRLLEPMCWDNELYGVVPISWPEYNLTLTDYLFAVNTDLVSRLGMPDPREYIEEGVWTRAKLGEVVDAYTSEDLGTEKTFGLTCNPYHFVVQSILSGVPDFLIQEGDTYKIAAYTDAGVRSLTWAADFLNITHKASRVPTNSNDTYACIDAFIEKKAVMVLMHSQFIFQTAEATGSSIPYSGIPFAILPFPLADDMEYGEWRTIFPMLKYATNILNTTEDPEAAATVLNAIYEPLEGFETQDDLRSYYLSNVFHDERDADLFFSFMNNSIYSYRGEGPYDMFVNMSLRDPQKVSEILGQYEDQVNLAIERYISNIRESRIAVFGE